MTRIQTIACLLLAIALVIVLVTMACKDRLEKRFRHWHDRNLKKEIPSLEKAD